MAISRNFMLIGTIFLILGIPIGMYMGASGNSALAPLHAHLNLLGFVLMMIFGLVYRAVPQMGTAVWARAHIWLHSIGAAILLVMLYLLLSGKITEAGMVPAAPVAELLVFLGILCFGWNLLRNGR